MPRAAVLALALAAAACGSRAPERDVDGGGGNLPPTVEIPRIERFVGFEAPVQVRASAVDPDGDSLRVEWTQLTGEPVDLASAETTTLRFTTHALDALAPPEDGPVRVLALGRREAGHYRFRLTATDEHGASASAEVEIQAAAANPGWPRAEQGAPTVLDLGREQERYAWEISFSPPRSGPELRDPDSRRPTILISSPGRYIFRETLSGREAAVHAGPWMGTRQCGRVECHPIEARGWALTKMATVLERGLDGRLRHDYGPECLRCHTVGWGPADNDGFDDVARQEGWEFPRRLRRGNYAALSEALEDRGNVGCEACHGPGRFFTSYSAQVCASCHDEPPDYLNPSEWRLAPMSKIRDGIVGDPVCERCHTAQGFLDELYGHEPAEETARVEDVQFDREPITCGVCHDTHAGEAERLVRYGGPLYGQDPDDVDWGTGIICLSCHHGGSQWAEPGGALVRPFVPREHSPPPPAHSVWLRRRAPHAPQGDVVRGRAGFALPGPGPIDATPPHLTVPGGCLGCHVRERPLPGDPRRGRVGGHTFAMFHGEGDSRVELTEACEGCHGPLDSLSRPARHDYDGNGRVEGIFEEVEGLLERCRRSVDAAIRSADITDGGRRATSFTEHDGYLVLVDARGELLGSEERPVTFPADQERLYRAVFNYALLLKDRSRGVHNPVLTVRLLQRTILRLTPRDVPRWYWR